MAEITGPISSAVILPEQPEAPFNAKRRQSSTTEDRTSKRPRLSTDGDSGTPAAESSKDESSIKPDLSEKAKAPGSDRRTNVQEERKRGQRLFGGLLSTLSQSTPNGQHKRRQEIEERQAEKRQKLERQGAERAQQEKQEAELRRAEKLVHLKDIRKTEQVKYDEESMRIRHSNMLAMANFLYTKTQPKLYYKPWELLPRDRDRIQAQIEEAETTIEREVESFHRKHSNGSEQTTTGKGSKTNGRSSKETVGEPRPESPSVPSVPVDTTNPPAQETVVGEEQSVDEHIGEVVFEAEEDTVIY